MNKSIFDVSGKTALVTGASSGLGAHFAKQLSHYGANVVLASRRVNELEKLAAEIDSTGGQALPIALDVTDEASVQHCFDRAESAFGTVRIVSNNAGVATSERAELIDKDKWDFVLRTNLDGAWLVAKESGHRMIEAKKGGSIVFTASILGLRVSVGKSSYATSKAAVIQLSNSLALEWARHDIRVNALCPGYFETEMTSKFFSSQKGREYIARSPGRRTGNLAELTAPFMLLASDAGSYVNGTALVVDGGHSIGNM